MKIGICDYGIGGIGLYQVIRKYSSADVVYFSDSGYTPYGKVPKEELEKRLEKVFEFLRSQGAEKIAVACNAASTVIPNDPEITGIIEHAITMVSKIKPATIAVVGGTRTIESNSYKNAFEQKGISTIQRIAQPLSIRIEAGDIESEGLDTDIRDIFDPIRNSQYILLACTHYPVIEDQIKKFTGDSILLDPVVEMYEWMKTHWGNLEGGSAVQWYTSGDTQLMKSSAEKCFKESLNHIEKISL